MSIKNKAWWVIGLLVHCYALNAMDAHVDLAQKEQQVEQEQSSVRYLSNKDNIPYAMRDAYKNSDFNHYASDAFVFNQQDVIDAMNGAVEQRGAQVHLSVGVHRENKKDRYKATEVSIDKDQHGKNTVCFDCSPLEDEPKKSLLRIGSANTTNAIWPTGNSESVVEITDNVPLTKQAYTLMRSRSPVKEKKDIVQTTPTKPAIYSSQKTALNESRAKRILNFAHGDEDDRIAWTSTMNFNNKPMAKALSKAAQSGVDTRLTVHKSALTKHGIPLLEQVADAGGTVSVFYPLEGSRVIHHKKELIRQSGRGDKDLLVISNANFTDEGDTQRNLELYFPGDYRLIAAAKTDFKRVEEVCVPLKDALALQKADNIKKAEKKRQKKDELKKIVEQKRKKRDDEDDVQAFAIKRRRTTE